MDNQLHMLNAVAQNEDTITINHNFEEILIKEEPLEINSQDQEFYENIFQNIKKEECVTYNDNQIDKKYDIISINNDILKTENTVSNSCIKCNKSLTRRTNLNNNLEIHEEKKIDYLVCEPDCEKLDDDNINENRAGCSKVKAKAKAKAKKSVRESDKLETFNPDDPNNNIDRWLAKLDELGEIYGWSDNERSYIMQMKLKGAARKLYNSQNSYDLSWAEWKASIIQAFRYDYAAMLRELLARVKYPEETMTSYYHAKMALCHSCQICDEKAVSLLINGLPPEIQVSAFAANCKTPKEFYSKFLAELGEYRGESVADSTHKKRKIESESLEMTKVLKIDTEKEPSEFLPKLSHYYNWKEFLRRKTPFDKKSIKKNPITSYILFSMDVRKRISQNNPGLTFGEISRLVGNEWSSLSVDERQTWEEMAQKYNDENAAMGGNKTEQSSNPAPPLSDKIYECLWSDCNYQFEDIIDCIDHCVQDGTGHVQTHFQNIPCDEADYLCHWKGCARPNKSMRRFLTLAKLLRHVREVHINKGNGKFVPVGERSKDNIIVKSTRRQPPPCPR